MGRPFWLSSALIASHILAFSPTFAKAQEPDRRYVVLLEQPSVARRVLESGVGLTREARRQLSSHPNWTGYRQQLLAAQEAIVQSIEPVVSRRTEERLTASRLQVLARRAFLLNVLVVDADENGRSRLEATPGVRRVVPIELREPLLDAAPALLNAPAAWEALGGVEEAGRGVRVGIIDSGINQSHPMFDDTGLEYPPGFPLVGQDPAFVNRKVIVARSYHELFGRPQNNKTPEDELGHGTRVASAAAGRHTLAPLGEVAGVAPMAYLGSYKVFGTPGINSSATNASITLALNDAVADGMDVINLSLGGSPRPPETDPEQMAIRVATGLGVVVVISAGNSGPRPGTVKSPGTSPEAITVGAVSNSRVFRATLEVVASPPAPPELQEIGYVPGSGVTIGALLGPFPLISAGGVDPSEEACGPLPVGSFVGRIVLIRRGNCTFQAKADNAFAAGARAVVVYNHLAGASPFTMSFSNGAGGAAVMIGNHDGEALRDFLQASASIPLSALQPTSSQKAVPSPADVLTSFSSRGPSIVEQVKPDVSAVGQGVYLASSDGISYRAGSNGTSFSAPLVAGAAALMRQLHPDWSSPQIKSSLVNSAVQAPVWNGLPASVNQTGAGRLDLSRALQAQVSVEPVSLTFGFLEGAELGEAQRRTVTLRNVTSEPLTLSLRYEALRESDDVRILLSDSSLTVPPASAGSVEVEAAIDSSPASAIFEGYLRISQPNGIELTVALWGGLIVPDDSVRLAVGPQGQFSNLQAALDAARPGNVVEVEEGTYAGNSLLRLNAEELRHDGVSIVAAAGARPLLRGATNDAAVIDVRDVEGFRIEGFRFSFGDRSIEVTDSSGFVVDNALEATAGSSFGIDALRSELGVVDNVVRDISGSAVAFFGGSGLLSGNRFGEAGSANDRYGVYAADARVALFGNRFAANNASGGTSALRVLRSTALVKGDLFGTAAAANRAAMYVDGVGARAEVIDSHVSGETSNGVTAAGGARVDLLRSRIENQTSNGLFALAGASLTGRGLTLRGNNNGVLAIDSDLSLSSTVVAESSLHGIDVRRSAVEIRNVTVSDNGGFGLTSEALSPALIANSIFSFNSIGDLNGAEAQHFFSNLIADGQLAGGNANMGADPGFDQNGTAFSLDEHSPAIDTGDAGFVSEATDIAAHVRVTDGDGDGVAAVDRGAREFRSDGGVPVIVPVLTTQPGRFSGLAFTNAATPPPEAGPQQLHADQRLLRLRAYDASGQLIGESTLEVGPGQQAAALAKELFAGEAAWIEVDSPDPDLMAFTLLGDFDLTLMDGSQLGPVVGSHLLFPELAGGGRKTTIRVVNPNPTPVAVTLRHSSGAETVRQLAARGSLSAGFDDLFEGMIGGYLEVFSDPPLPLAGLETFGDESSIGGLWALDGDRPSETLFAAHFVKGLAVTTTLNIVNLGQAGTVRLEAFDENGALLDSAEVQLGAGAQLADTVASLFELAGFSGTGWVRITSATGGLAGSLRFEGDDGRFIAVLPLQSDGARESVFSHVAHNTAIFTGITLLNPTEEGALLILEVFDRDGTRVGRALHRLGPGEKIARLLNEWVEGLETQVDGFIRVRSNSPLFGFELFGAWDLEFLAAVPQQRVVP